MGRKSEKEQQQQTVSEQIGEVVRLVSILVFGVHLRNDFPKNRFMAMPKIIFSILLATGMWQLYYFQSGTLVNWKISLCFTVIN